MQAESHVLVVMAHPDDETFAVGGTIALYTQAGVPVTYACATGGEMGRRMGKPAFTNREQLRRGSGRWCTALRRRRCGCASGPGGPRA